MNTNGGFRTLAGNMADSYQNAGAPTNGTDEIQTLTSTGTGGTFDLTITNPSGTAQTLTGIAFNVTAAALQTLIQAMANVGGANITCAGGPLNTTPITLTFVGTFSGLDITQVTVSNTNLTGGTVVPSTTTPGVQGTQRGAAKGALLADTTTPKLYQNSGTANKPTWSVVGAQT
jgi:hypothetical protein